MSQKMLSHPKKMTFRELFKKGDLPTKLSFLFMGTANLCNKQIPKGLLFLGSEILFFFWLIRNGVTALAMLQTLGTKKQGLVYNKDLGIEVLQKGDNSMLILLFGIAAILTCAMMIYLYIVNLKSARKLYELKQENKPIPTTRDDLRSLLNERFHATLMTIPLLGVLLFTILPLLYMISIAFTNYDHNHLPPKQLFTWVAFKNFSNVITGDMASTFFPVLVWTLIWAVMATVTCFIFGVILALLINTKGIKGKKFWRTLFVLTMAVPQFVSLLIMRNLLNDAGPINSTLMNLGIIKSALPFLTDPTWAKFSIIFVNMWIGIPVTMIITTGILQNLPTDQIEAARIDGANSFQIFRSITFPQILFVMMPSLIQQLVGNINNFNVIYLLTGGGPSNSDFYGAGSTDLLVTWLYKLTVDTMDYNLASVIGILIFILSAVFSLAAYTRTNSFKEG
ncbi:sugar ABC transporter permease [Enterococcus cecorum]|uniref:Maltose/maltodextrin transport system permease protein n=1 Tax=Enterococcus cecorum TaxID=44008 RepID=A0A7X9NL67_9ENTE|nr:sugar ABC transporter permease [Enterococcus cecorum]MCJ0521645.1 sugar ABC transporter permease [Enterococcus cecorum]MCJ0560285.1 sugar ABC transporter permease [Enterococcus cecorum]MCJ0598124.1 sugar ABC transporter permease [Enterococcus cecorum]MCJ0604361.1 sugar ABC transporter permease [Enterococcus cecorum]MDZ5581558.1 sugar ABC transporter permease [Enterococcus cecorum]